MSPKSFQKSFFFLPRLLTNVKYFHIWVTSLTQQTRSSR